MSVVCSLLGGYLLGSISFAQLFATLNGVNLRSGGTGNLGGTNAILLMGRGVGVTVMLMDILKGFLAVLLAQWTFPSLHCAGLLAGAAAVFGHVYPFYLRFKGGKGHATLIGCGLALCPGELFLMTLCSFSIALALNYGCLFSMANALLFPLLIFLVTGDALSALIALAAGLLVFGKHFDNIRKIRAGEENQLRPNLKKFFSRAKKQ